MPRPSAYRIVSPDAPVLDFPASGGIPSRCSGGTAVMGRLTLARYPEGVDIVRVNSITNKTVYAVPNLLLDGNQATTTKLLDERTQGTHGQVSTFEWADRRGQPSVAVKVQKWTNEAETAIQSLSDLAECELVNFRAWIVMNPTNSTPRAPAEVCAPGTCRHKQMCLTVLRP